MKKISLGFSAQSQRNAFRAGQEAARMALDLLSGAANFLFLLTTPDYEPLETLRGITSVANMPLIGCPAEQIIATTGIHSTEMAAVMAFQVRHAQLFVEQGNNGGREKAAVVGRRFAEQVAESLLAQEHTAVEPLLLLLIDSRLEAHVMTESIANTLGPLVSVIGGVLNGACSSAGPFMNTEPRGAAIVGALLYPYAPVGTGVAHGWQPSGHAAVATHTNGNVILEINGRPAFKVYQDIWREMFPDISGKSEDEFQRAFRAFAIYSPIGLAQIDEEYLLRSPVYIKDDAIICAGGVPENAILHFMRGEANMLGKAAEMAMQQALSRIQQHQPEAVLLIDCVTRFTRPDYTLQNELAHIQRLIGTDVPLLGFPSWGEIMNPPQRMIEYHNKALVVSAFS